MQDRGRVGRADTLRARILETPLAALDVSEFDYFEHDVADLAFERLRRESPVHYCPESAYGAYWSITSFKDLRAVEIDHARFSSAGNTTIKDDTFGDFRMPSFIAMDPPEHDQQRKAVRPAVAPRNLRKLEGTIRSRAAAILDGLPVGESFDWVEHVSIELTAQMLATILGFPIEERMRLIRWSDVSTNSRAGTRAQRRRELEECQTRFLELWQERAAAEPGPDMISMLAHADATRDLASRPMELLGNILLLIVGGNDTTRNSISGGVLALNRFPEEYEKVRADPGIIPNMVSEIIRWQSPVIHQRRTAIEDVELQGQKIRSGEKVVLWYLSANYDEAVFPEASRFLAGRDNASHHMAFGFGIHRCMGAHLAEMQLRVLWEEIVQRFEFVEVLAKPTRLRSNFLRGITRMPVRLHAR
jgi:cytochrome P450